MAADSIQIPFLKFTFKHYTKRFNRIVIYEKILYKKSMKKIHFTNFQF